eukprot:SAG22_NODE_138_length_18031_cov_5.796621_20_plen_61_part_00
MEVAGGDACKLVGGDSARTCSMPVKLPRGIFREIAAAPKRSSKRSTRPFVVQDANREAFR